MIPARCLATFAAGCLCGAAAAIVYAAWIIGRRPPGQVTA